MCAWHEEFRINPQLQVFCPQDSQVWQSRDCLNGYHANECCSFVAFIGVLHYCGEAVPETPEGGKGCDFVANASVWYTRSSNWRTSGNFIVPVQLTPGFAASAY